MKARLLTVDDSSWSTYLGSVRHDFFHLPGYVALAARDDQGDPWALLVEDGANAMLLPLVLRRVPGGGWDASSPYGYPGPLAHGNAEPSFMAEALTSGIEMLATRDVVSLFLRSHPILNHRLPDGPWTIVYHGDTVAIDLSLSPEEHWSQTRRDHRTQVRRAEREGYVATWDPDWSHFSEFQSLYRATMLRRSAADSYLFDEAYFDGLRTALGDRIRLAVTHKDGKLAAASLFVDCDGIVQYYLSGTDAGLGREAAWATKAMIHFVRDWARDGNRRWLHLGGGVSAREDSLFLFKAGFSPLRHRFHTLRAVVIPTEYERLVRAYDSTADPTKLDGYFPAFRGSGTANAPR